MKLRSGFSLRLALIIDLWVYLLFVVLFLVLPLFPNATTFRVEDNSITVVEGFFACLVVIPSVLLVGRLFKVPRIKFNEWAYMATALYGLVVLAAFLTYGQTQVFVPPERLTLTIVTFFIGIFGAAGAHVLDGGDSPLGPVVERRIEEQG